MSQAVALPIGTISPMERSAVLSVAMWIFIAVASALFGLFLAAYVMRMTGPDWSPVKMPWQLWCSTVLLITGSLSFQRSSAAAKSGKLLPARGLLMLAGVCALGFLISQLWAWQTLLGMQVTTTGNPAGSFFYLLTAMHGLHVVGGLICWAVVARFALRQQDSEGLAWRAALCARYWHFLLLLWIVLFAALVWVTPDFVRYICGTR